MNDKQAVRAFWNAEAERFDDEPDHGARSPVVRAAWTRLLNKWLPSDPSRVLDLGCGTGTLSELVAELGHAVTGVDLSPAMLAHARDKVPGVTFIEGDAADPPLPSNGADVAMCRHVLWALPDHDQVVQRWNRLLVPGGRLLLIEGRWHTGSGLDREQMTQALSPHVRHLEVHTLDDPDLWGGPLTDDRFLVSADV